MLEELIKEVNKTDNIGLSDKDKDIVISLGYKLIENTKNIIFTKDELVYTFIVPTPEMNVEANYVLQVSSIEHKYISPAFRITNDMKLNDTLVNIENMIKENLEDSKLTVDIMLENMTTKMLHILIKETLNPQLIFNYYKQNVK